MNGLLSLLIFLPVVGTLVVFCVPREKASVIRWVTTLFAGAEFLASIPLWTFAGFRRSGDFFFRETHDWIPSLGARYALGVDGIAALLILLTTLLSFISVYASFSAITKREKEYYVFLLLLETGMMGVFCALDFFLFYVFWEVMLVPMYFLIGIWGGPRRLYAAIKFFLYTLAGSVVMLLAIIALYFFNTSGFLWWKGLGQRADVRHRPLPDDRVADPGATSSCGSSGRSSSASRSRCRCSRSTRGCRTPTSRRPRRARSSSRASS